MEFDGCVGGGWEGVFEKVSYVWVFYVGGDFVNDMFNFVGVKGLVVRVGLLEGEVVVVVCEWRVVVMMLVRMMCNCEGRKEVWCIVY